VSALNAKTSFFFFSRMKISPTLSMIM
jgi:hypothetical protein